MAVAVAACVEPSLNIVSNVLAKIVGLNAVNEGVCVHIAQLKILAILWEHVVVMKLVHDNLTKIENDLPQVDGFVP